MLFNSISFIIFFPFVVFTYFLLPQKYRWIFLLGASYYFYMNWKPVYAVLISLSTLFTFLTSILIEDKKKHKKLFLIISCVFNFGILFVFKYFNFINTSVFEILDNFNIRWEVPNFDLLLPVGISFYTFQAVGYTIDVYRGNIKAERHLGIYALFVSFFPQLVAGPIERAKNLLPQFRKKHYFNYEDAVSGLKLMLMGYFMKVVVADRLALYVDAVYNNIPMHNGTSIIIATLFFSFQIYCDFAGYSSIAIGAARIMGFRLMTNFNRPYFSTSISEFWSRWHISLSTWFKDYLYIPLGGNRVSRPRNYFNLFITFLVSGIWHGANWTFVVWGSLHGFYLIIEKFFKLNVLSNEVSGIKRFIKIVVTFVLVNFAWIFFRANSVADGFIIIKKVFTQPGTPFINPVVMGYSAIGLGILLMMEIGKEYFSEKFQFLESNDIYVRYASYLA